MYITLACILCGIHIDPIPRLMCGQYLAMYIHDWNKHDQLLCSVTSSDSKCIVNVCNNTSLQEFNFVGCYIYIYMINLKVIYIFVIKIHYLNLFLRFLSLPTQHSYIATHIVKHYIWWHNSNFKVGNFFYSSTLHEFDIYKTFTMCSIAVTHNK